MVTVCLHLIFKVTRANRESLVAHFRVILAHSMLRDIGERVARTTTLEDRNGSIVLDSLACVAGSAAVRVSHM